MKKVVDEEELNCIIADLHSDNCRVVSTSGCFDILHAGHVMYLAEAKKKGDVLVVLLNSDASVKRIKGPKRPIVSESERAYVLAGLESVDYVCLFDDLTPCRIIERIHPDIVIKGGDYREQHIPEMDSVARYGGIVEYVSLKDGCSTTSIIDRIVAL